MSPAIEDILRAALALTEEERTELIEELLSSQPESGDLPFDPGWLSVIQRRSAKVDEGRVTLTLWAEVRDRVRERVKG
jgi:hypothetical protein